MTIMAERRGPHKTSRDRHWHPAGSERAELYCRVHAPQYTRRVNGFSDRLLAKHMNIKVTQARNLARNLRMKKYLDTTVRFNLPNLFYLQPLFGKLEKLRDEKLAEEEKE
jgi:hypothetical protein